MICYHIAFIAISQ